MTVDDVTAIMSNGLFMVIKIAVPVLLVSLIVGLSVSIFQTVTSIQDQTLTFVPKIIITFLALMLLGNWMLTELSNYVVKIWSDFSLYIH
ncbi:MULTISPECIES: flagellar biosynthesis protein FliQ [unclassified Butyrivibrio]|uniref:flagellar biosynthesis protein FliQ n=1 Tax=unclassified Butyrivibrio TaxID=2639466 RepID=UPI0003B5D7ED|nr:MULTISPECIES: flagellar biosynthesis protein FliQ [unclassified Butyrivibrio]SDB39358.1 flagellar biosynthetic protein FliQ [Butyrivibrio sp. INlla16]SEK44170.1 flagellar biosynthetic protein FliQ [Butyrivibrio sp. ob235]